MQILFTVQLFTSTKKKIICLFLSRRAHSLLETPNSVAGHCYDWPLSGDTVPPFCSQCNSFLFPMLRSVLTNFRKLRRPLTTLCTPCTESLRISKVAWCKHVLDLKPRASWLCMVQRQVSCPEVPFVRRVDGAIHWITQSVLLVFIRWIVTYSVDSVIGKP